MKILIVEDNEKIRNELSALLRKYNYDVVAPDEFGDIFHEVEMEKPHLILLDINLPIFDGFYICREIRKNSNIPIIVVTSRDSDMDELMSMNCGADDFVTKPYHTQILLARIESILRRVYKTGEAVEVIYNNIVLNLARSVVSSCGNEAELSKNELRILHLLLKHPQTIVSRDDIMDDLWQSDEFVDDNTLTVNINRLRKKLESIGVNDFIITKRGLGYMV